VKLKHYQWRKKMQTYGEMQTYGGMQFKTLSRRILGRCAGSMRGMKGCKNIGFIRWKKLCHHLSMSL